MTRKGINITRNLVVDQEFCQFLLNTNSIVGRIITNLDLEKSLNYIAPTGIQDKISYLPETKIKSEPNFDPFAPNIGRVQIKIGRFINKLISPEIMEKHEISKSEIEKFVNQYKSWFDSSNYTIKVVEGEIIRDYYNETNYYAPNGNFIGTLWNSCMRYVRRLKFLDLYIKNSNCKMLVMLQNVDGKSLVRGRALLWDDVKVIKDWSNSLPDTIKVMDRIYTVFDSDVNLFKKWANQNGYIPKYEQNAKSHQFFDIKGECIRIRCEIELEKSKLSTYPYLDTFPYFNYTEGIISNDEYGFNWDYKLVQANGDLEPQTEQEEEGDTW